MIYICYGIPKSASSFAFTIAYDIACLKTDQAALWESFPGVFNNEYLENLDVNIDRLLSMVPENEVLVIKTHQRLTQKLHDWLHQGVCRAQVSIRDPYDIALSLFEAGERERERPPSRQRKGFTEIHTMEDALDRTRQVLIDAVYWLEFQEQLQYPVIDYSQVCKHPYEVARRIADNIGVSADTDRIVTKYVSDKLSIDEFNKGIEGRGRERIKLDSKDPGKRLFDTFCDRYLGLSAG